MFSFLLCFWSLSVNLSCDKVGILPFVAIYTVLNDRVACQHILLYPPTETELCRSARMNTSVASKCVYFLDHELDQASFLVGEDALRGEVDLVLISTSCYVKTT